MYDTKGIKSDFGKAAGDYDQKAKLQQQVLEETIEAIRPHWPEKSHIADIGSGTGMLAEYVKKRALGWNITACDIAYGMCAVAASRNIPAINGDVHQLPFADESFDGVFSSLMLQWANEPAKAFCEIARILKKDSYAVITTFSNGTLAELSEAFKAVDANSHTSEFTTMNALAPLASAAGFSVKQIHEKNLVEFYEDTLQLMHAIRTIGASHKPSGDKPSGGRRGLTKSQLQTLEKEYKARFATEQGLPVTWRVLRLVLKKK